MSGALKPFWLSSGNRLYFISRSIAFFLPRLISHHSLVLLFAKSIRFGPSLRYIELPIELITATVLQELGSKCPNLTHMLLDFSTAMQLHDFNELQGFPTKLRYMCICLSEVIFMEGFMRKIYSFINGLEILHLIGTILQ